MHALLLWVPLTLQQATTDPCLRWRLLNTQGKVWVSLFWGYCSFFLVPGTHKVLFVPSKSLFPQFCVSSGSSMVGLMVTSSKRAYAIPAHTNRDPVQPQINEVFLKTLKIFWCYLFHLNDHFMEIQQQWIWSFTEWNIARIYAHCTWITTLDMPANLALEYKTQRVKG